MYDTSDVLLIPVFMACVLCPDWSLKLHGLNSYCNPVQTGEYQSMRYVAVLHIRLYASYTADCIQHSQFIVKVPQPCDDAMREASQDLTCSHIRSFRFAYGLQRHDLNSTHVW